MRLSCKIILLDQMCSCVEQISPLACIAMFVQGIILTEFVEQLVEVVHGVFETGDAVHVLRCHDLFTWNLAFVEVAVKTGCFWAVPGHPMEIEESILKCIEECLHVLEILHVLVQG